MAHQTTGLNSFEVINQQFMDFKSIGVNFETIKSLVVGESYNGSVVTSYTLVPDDFTLNVELADGQTFFYSGVRFNGVDQRLFNFVYEANDFRLFLTGSFVDVVYDGFLTGIQFTSFGQSSLTSSISVNYSEFILIDNYTDLMTYLLSGNDTITGTFASNLIFGGAGNDLIDGMDGSDDTLLLTVNKDNVSSVLKLSDNSYQVTSSDGYDQVTNVEFIQFADGTKQDLSSLSSEYPVSSGVLFRVFSNGTDSLIPAVAYVGSVSFLQYQLILGAEDQAVTGTSFNDFINLGGGFDAANGGDGDDVLDGGTGSNFLTGGNGTDIFFSDGRGGEITWSTVTDFTQGEQINIWGWQEGISKLALQLNNEGAEGYKGATFHYDLDNNGIIDTSVTLSGITLDQLTASTGEVAGNGYVLIV